MRIAVTGGTGLVGTPLVQRLTRAGHEVRVLTRSPERHAAALPKGAHVVAFDAAAPRPPEGLLDGVDAVVTLGGEPIAQRWTAAARERILTSRVAGTALIVEAAREAGTVRALLASSAVHYYGERGAELLTEESAPGAGFLAEVCREWERAALQAEGPGCRVVRLRLGVVLHPSGGALARLLPLFRLGLGGRHGSGRQYLSWIHREDCVGLIEHALAEEELRGPLNVTAPEPVTNAELAAELGRVLRRPAFAHVPAAALRLALGEMSEALLDSVRALPRRAEASGFRFAFPTLREALADLVGR